MRPGKFHCVYRLLPALFQRPLDSTSANPEGSRYLPTCNSTGPHFLNPAGAVGDPPLLPTARLLLNAFLQRTFQAGRVQVATPVPPVPVFLRPNRPVHDAKY